MLTNEKRIHPSKQTAPKPAVTYCSDEAGCVCGFAICRFSIETRASKPATQIVAECRTCHTCTCMRGPDYHDDFCIAPALGTPNLDGVTAILTHRALGHDVRPVAQDRT